MMAESLVTFDDITVSFGEGASLVRALTNVSFVVESGTMVVVQGPSGCGKSTLLNLACGVTTANSGTVTVAGHDVGRLSAAKLALLRRRDIGVVFQRLNLLPSLSMIENVMLPLELEGVTRKEALRQASGALDTVSFDGAYGRFPDELSGGEQQRVAIARAIVGDRRLILADEPTAALDSVTGERIIDLLRSLVDQHGKTVVLVTHESRYAAWAHRVVGLRDGEINSDRAILRAS
jgi:putative ABC transport system ATP-binding protein